MLADTRTLLLIEDLEGAGRTGELPDVDLGALRAVADWIRNFEARPHPDLGRWARRYGESGALALAEQVRRLPWRATGER